MVGIIKELLEVKDTGTFTEFCDAFKSFDREGMGYITAGEMSHMLTSIGMYIFMTLELIG